MAHYPTIPIESVINLRKELDVRVTQVMLRAALAGRATTTQLSALAATVGTGGTGGGDISDLQNQIDALESEVATKADESDLTSLSNTVAGKASQSDLTSLSNTVAGKADQADLNALEQSINSAGVGVTTFFNVKTYGAVGDGVTDDTAAIKAAIEAANPTDGSGPMGNNFATYDWYNRAHNDPRATGGKVFLPAGLYKITEALPIVGMVEICGEGSGTVIMAVLPDGSPTETGAFVVHRDSVDSCYGAVIRDLDVWTQFGHGFDLSGGPVTWMLIDNVQISAGGWAIYAPELNTNEDDGTGTYMQNCLFENIRCLQSGGGAFYAAGNLNAIRRITTSGSGVRQEVQLLTIVGTGGNYTISFNYQSTLRTTGSLSWNAAAATVQAALEGLSTIGSSNITVEQISWNGTNTRVFRVTFAGSNTDYATSLRDRNLPLLTASSSLTGPGAGVTVTQGLHGFSEPNIQKSEILALNITAGGGTFTLTVEGSTTSAINYNANAAAIKAALDALSKGTWTVAAGSGYTWRLTNTLGRRTGTSSVDPGSLSGGSATLTVRQKGFTDKAMLVIKGSGWLLEQPHVETSTPVQAIKLSGIGPIYGGFSTSGVTIDNAWVENNGDATDDIVWSFDSVSRVEIRNCGNGSTDMGKIYVRDVTDLFFDRLTGDNTAGDKLVFDPLDELSVISVGTIYDQWGFDVDRAESRVIVRNNIVNQYGQEIEPAPQARFGNLLYPKPTIAAYGATAALTYEQVADIGYCWKLTWSSNPSGNYIDIDWPMLIPPGITSGQTNVYVSGIMILGSPDPGIMVRFFYGFGGTSVAFAINWTRTGPFLAKWNGSSMLGWSSLQMRVLTTHNTYGSIYFKNLALTVGGRFQPPAPPPMVIYHADGRIETSGTAAPADGTWTRGSVCHNRTPSAGGPARWICVTAGTPGTWKAEANVAP